MKEYGSSRTFGNQYHFNGFYLEKDFHTHSYGFLPEHSVHHAICTVKLQFTDCGETRGRLVIESDCPATLTQCTSTADENGTPRAQGAKLYGPAVDNR